MRKKDYDTYKRNRCEYCTDCKGRHCKNDRCLYQPEAKKYTGMPWEAVFGRVVV